MSCIASNNGVSKLVPPPLNVIVMANTVTVQQEPRKSPCCISPQALRHTGKDCRPNQLAENHADHILLRVRGIRVNGTRQDEAVSHAGHSTSGMVV